LDGKRSITVCYKEGFFRITPYADNILHVSCFAREEKLLEMWGIQALPDYSVHYEKKDADGRIEARYPRITVFCRDNDPTLEFRDSDGKLLTTLLDVGFEPGEREAFQVRALFTCDKDEAFYGLGQHQNYLMNQKGKEIKVWHDYDAPGGESVGVPFLVSSKNYGILFDNTSRITVRPVGDEKYEWICDIGDALSFFIFCGSNADEVYGCYRKLTGAAPIPPKYAFGFMQSKERYKTQQELLEVGRKYREKGYPCDMLIVDWYHWKHLGDFTMDPEYWPDPAEMNRELKELGFRTMVSIWPRAVRESPNYAYLEKKGWFMRDKDGKPVYGTPTDPRGPDLDTTNPECGQWLWGKIRDGYYKNGFSAWWLDETEPDIPPLEYYFHVGSGARYFNLYPYTHAEAVYKGHRKDTKERCLSMLRAAFTGTQRFGAIFWSSDINCTWDAYKRQVPCGLNFCASGMPYWSSDIGGWHSLDHPLAGFGYYPDEYPELFIRWFQYGAFCPIFRTHGRRKENEVWSYGEEAERILVKYLKLRYRLLPYIYSNAWFTWKTGAPFMRALFMDFGHDRKVLDIKDQYMFGKAIMVAPVVNQGQTKRNVYLPEGSDWYDFWTNELYSGGQVIEAEAPLDRLPLYVKAGSIIPMGNDILSTAQKQDILDILVYPGADAEFVLYDDDGVTYNYEEGEFREIKIRWNDADKALTIEDEDEARNIYTEININIIKQA